MEMNFLTGQNSFGKNLLTLFTVSIFAISFAGSSSSLAGGEGHKSKSEEHEEQEDRPLYEQTDIYSADGRPHFPGVNSVTQRLFVSDVPAGTVTMFDSATGVILAETATGSQAHTVVADEQNNLVYVANRGSDTLSILDGNTNAVVAEIPVGDGPHGLDLDLEHGRAFTSNTFSYDITVVDTETRQVVRTIPVGIEPWGVTYDAENDWIYVANTGDGSVWRIDPDNGKVLKKFKVGGRPWNVKVSQETGRVYATNETLGILSVMNNKRVIAELPIGIAGRGLVLNEELGLAFAVATGSNQVTTVDMKKNKVVQTIPVGAAPTAATLDVLTNAVYVANQGGGTISVLRPLAESDD